MIINHNMASLNTYRQLSTNNANSSKSLEKLSSGLRINKAGDDAAGLAISEKMRGQIRGLDQAARNAQDSISMIQTAEGSLSETQSILQRMKELATQAANDTNTTDDRGEIQKEINQLTSEINRIGNTTEFNTKKLLNGDFDFKAATSGVTKASLAVSSTVEITNTDTKGYVTGGAYGTAGIRNAKDTAASATGTIDADAIAIGNDNNELTLKIDGVQKNIEFTATLVSGNDVIDEINAQLSAVGANAKFDSTTGKLTIQSNTLGSGGSIEILGGNFATEFMDADVKNIVHTEGKDVGDVWIHGDVGAEVTGGRSVDNTSLGLDDITVDASGGMNELTLVIDGEEKTFTLGDKTYDGSDATHDMATLITDLQTAIDGAGFSGGRSATVSVDSSNKLVITSDATGASSSVEIKGGGLADELFDVIANRTSQERQAANNTIDIDVDGSTETVTLANQVYQDLDEFISVNSTAFGTAGVTASNDSGKLKLVSDTTGSDSEVTNIAAGDATKQLGLVKSDGTALNAGNFIAGANGNTTLSITVDGESVDAVIQEGDYTDRKLLAAAVQSAINNATTTAADVAVSVNDDNELVITSGSTGHTSSIAIGAHGTKDAAGILGLTTNDATAGEDQAKAELKFQIGANQGQGMNIQISDMRSEALKVSSAAVSGDASATTGVAGSYFVATQEVTDGTNSDVEEYALDVSSFEKATAAVKVLDNAINAVSAERSKLGAYTNRLEHTVTNLGTSSENLTAAESRIRDVDMAKEMMNFQKNNILSQAAQAMLAQANQQPQGVLQLLR